jgi:hypothetical protein
MRLHGIQTSGRITAYNGRDEHPPAELSFVRRAGIKRIHLIISPAFFLFVMPANAGIQFYASDPDLRRAGMNTENVFT